MGSSRKRKIDSWEKKARRSTGERAQDGGVGTDKVLMFLEKMENMSSCSLGKKGALRMTSLKDSLGKGRWARSWVRCWVDSVLAMSESIFQRPHVPPIHLQAFAPLQGLCPVHLDHPKQHKAPQDRRSKTILKDVDLAVDDVSPAEARCDRTQGDLWVQDDGRALPMAGELFPSLYHFLWLCLWGMRLMI